MYAQKYSIRWECEKLKTCFDLIIIILDICRYSNEEREKEKDMYLGG